MQKLKSYFLHVDISVWYMLLWAIIVVAGDAIVKDILKGLPAIEIVFFRSLFAIILLSVSFWKKSLVQTGGMFMLLLSRGIFGALGTVIFYYLLVHIPLANATVFLQSSAIFASFDYIFGF